MSEIEVFIKNKPLYRVCQQKYLCQLVGDNQVIENRLKTTGRRTSSHLKYIDCKSPFHFSGQLFT